MITTEVTAITQSNVITGVLIVVISFIVIYFLQKFLNGMTKK